MLTNKRCKIILNKNRENKLTDKEVEHIKNFLEGYAKMIINNLLNQSI